MTGSLATRDGVGSIGGVGMSWMMLAAAVGLVISVIDTVALVAARGIGADSEAAQYVSAADQIANIVLFSILGFRVGRGTGLARSAAEAGVLAGSIAGLVAVAVGFAVPSTDGERATTREIISVLALNVAMGGLVSLANGWIGSRAEATRRDRRG